MKRKLKKVALVAGILFAALITLFVLWASWENWTGARKWQAVREELEAAEVELDIKKLIPTDVPAEDNFCAAPIIAPLRRLANGRSMESSLSDVDSILRDESDGLAYANPEGRQRVLAC